jgi:hypothetical protein
MRDASAPCVYCHLVESGERNVFNAFRFSGVGSAQYR